MKSVERVTGTLEPMREVSLSRVMGDFEPA